MLAYWLLFAFGASALVVGFALWRFATARIVSVPITASLVYLSDESPTVVIPDESKSKEPKS